MEQQFSTINIHMPKVKLSLLQTKTFIYQIDVATRWAKWHLEKKYIEFQELHNRLVKEFDDLPQFPQSFLNIFTTETEDQASEYQEILEEYLQEASKRKDIINSQAFIEFLQLEKQSPMLLARKPKFLHEFQMQQRINDEGKVIHDLYYSQNFIVFATGNDSPLEKFNSIVANSKFPWESDQEVEYVLPLGTIECWAKKKDSMSYKRVWARNYPIQTRCFIFSITSMTMVVGLSDGSVEVFNLIQKPRYVYYQMPKMVTPHGDDVVGLHLDQLSKNIYSASQDGWVCVIDSDRGVVINKQELASQITCMHADSKNRRLFLALQEGNIEIFEYNDRGTLKYLYSLSPPADSSMTKMLFDPIKGYLFASCYESGEIFIFQIGKYGQEKLSKQIGTIKNKAKIVDMVWKVQRMELVVANQSGEIFFWNTVKGEHIYMLKAFDQMELSTIKYLKGKSMIITASRGRVVKFWEMPEAWRDALVEVEEERQLEIRRKVENMYKVREAVKRKEVNSDEDDLKGWHWSSSESSDDQ